ncbi:hypothetical protein [Clostridium scatologenes]|uniref:Uncharacterized protein n=1 Tax=Clostridium scatologenes TaxID=1548 RepID=A0A0E3GS03_CLOSL|nr:hypothetical protein [Clostridium scatologenes]AKA71221.1 hypothetical protein CSCA_4096 [Clostridium scatologenes]
MLDIKNIINKFLGKEEVEEDLIKSIDRGFNDIKKDINDFHTEMKEDLNNVLNQLNGLIEYIEKSQAETEKLFKDGE